MPSMTYAMSTPMPCDDCKHRDFCLPNGGTCKVSRYWETYGSVLRHKRFGSPIEGVPDGNIVITKHSWNSK